MKETAHKNERKIRRTSGRAAASSSTAASVILFDLYMTSTATWEAISPAPWRKLASRLTSSVYHPPDRCQEARCGQSDLSGPSGCVSPPVRPSPGTRGIFLLGYRQTDIIEIRMDLLPCCFELIHVLGFVDFVSRLLVTQLPFHRTLAQLHVPGLDRLVDH